MYLQTLDDDGSASEDQVVGQPQSGVDRGEESCNCQPRQRYQSVQSSAVGPRDRRRAEQSCPSGESTARAIARLLRGSTVGWGVGTSVWCIAERPARACSTRMLRFTILRHPSAAHNNTTENILCSLYKVWLLLKCSTLYHYPSKL